MSALILELIRLMQLYLSLSEFLQFQPTPKLNNRLHIPSEALHIILTFSLLRQVINHKLIEIIYQILRQVLLCPQLIPNLIKIPIQHLHNLPFPPIFQLLRVFLDNPPKT